MFSDSDQTPAPPTETATVGFVDLAGFSAITEVYGDTPAVAMLELFESLVGEALGEYGPPVKWIRDEAMVAFPGPEAALKVLGQLLPACRSEPELPLTRSALNHGPVVRRGGDLFGTTVNIASRIAALAEPGQLLATEPVAEAAGALGIATRALGPVSLRSVAHLVALYEIELAPAADPAWIDPVCKMHAPWAGFRREAPETPWFCSERCAEAYRLSPETYPTGAARAK